MDNKIILNKFEIEKLPQYDNHYLIIYFNQPEVNLRGFIAIHRNKLPVLGGTRFIKYGSELDALKDALLLSKSMTYKCVAANINYGGGKAVIIQGNNVKKTKALLKAYAKVINNLGGILYTGEDAGITAKDVNFMHKYSKFFIGSYKKAGSPSPWAALGTLYAIKGALNFLFGNNKIEGRSFAIKGLGKTGERLAKLILEEGGNVFGADIDKKVITKVKQDYPAIKTVDPKIIHKLQVNVFCPCDWGNSINQKNVKELNCKIICGTANNQLSDKSLATVLFKRKIIYVPDYLANCGGLINVAEELNPEGYSVKNVIKKIKQIQKRTEKILELSSKNKVPPLVALNNFIQIRVDKNYNK